MTGEFVVTEAAYHIVRLLNIFVRLQLTLHDECSEMIADGEHLPVHALNNVLSILPGCGHFCVLLI